MEFITYRLSSPQITRSYADDINRVYAVFREVWDQEEEVLNGNENTSDLFFNNDTLHVLYCHGEVAAFAMTRYANLELIAHRHQSWFSSWPASLLQDFIQKGLSEVCYTNHLTVAPDFQGRRKIEGVYTSLLVSQLIVMHYYYSGEEVFFGAYRKNRGTDKIGEALGATNLGETLFDGRIEATMVGYFHDRIEQSIDEMPAITKNLYFGAKHHGSERITDAVQRRHVMCQGANRRLSLA